MDTEYKWANRKTIEQVDKQAGEGQAGGLSGSGDGGADRLWGLIGTLLVGPQADLKARMDSDQKAVLRSPGLMGGSPSITWIS